MYILKIKKIYKYKQLNIDNLLKHFETMIQFMNKILLIKW